MAKNAEADSYLPFATVLERLARARGPRGIDALAVQTALGLRSLFLAERLLIALGGWRRRFETPEEFVTVAQNMMAAPIATKIEFLFNLHDIDGDGWIRRDELDRLIHIALAENEVALSAERADQLVDAVMGAGDRNNDQRIGGAEFVQMMVSHPEIQRRLADYGVSLLMPGARARRKALLPGAALGAWVRSGVMLAFWAAAYVGVNAYLFMDAVLRYQAAGANVYVQLARGCGACLNFNGALVVLPMLRHTLTWVRRSALGRIVPVDDAVGIHGLIGEIVVLFGVVHSAAHLLNARAALAAGVFPLSRTNATGLLLLLIFAVMWLFSRSFVRRSGHFELFHVTHLGYFAAVVLLFVHGPHYWMWGTVPWLWYLGERLLRARGRRAPSRVLSARALPSGVTRLDFRRPPGFDYSAGDYVFLNVPAVARHEWHPFTLTSAPGDRAALTVHVRSVGNWTSALAERVTGPKSAGKKTAVRIDGPYGSASRHIFEAPHAVAIGAGIGVTPFASILQSLLRDQNQPDSRLQKLRFVWLNRDQFSFEWFRDLLAQLEKQDRAGLLDIHIFMTGGRSDMAGGLLDVAQHELRSKKSGDLVTGLRTHTTFGKPDFDQLLEGFYRSVDLPRPQVFFCGPAPLGRIVSRSCHRLGLRFRRERF